MTGVDPKAQAMTTQQAETLLMSLLRADSESDVIALLRRHDLWDDATLWRDYGDTESNFSSAGNQQRNPEAALVEKIVNSVDACLMNKCIESGIDPRSQSAPANIREAVAIFYEGATAGQVRDYQGYLAEWSSDRRTEVARTITLCVTGPRAEEGGAPSITIADAGEGQTPEAIPETILSLNRGIKKAVRFVQGKFNMGGTGALRFCGRHNLQLVLSKRNPRIAATERSSGDWGFTIVRRDDPDEHSRISVYRYLAPLGAATMPRHGDLLTITRGALPIFPEGQRPYSRNASWGTVLKLYEYDTRFKTHLFRRGGLQERLDLYIPGLALPVRLHECRNYRGSPGSFETTLAGLQVRLTGSTNLEFPPDSGEIVVDGESIAMTLYAFKRDAAATYRRNEGVLFVVNGQTHASLAADRFFRRARMGYLKDSLLVLLDCGDLSGRTKEELFMNSRDRLADVDLAHRIEDELADVIGRHEELKALREKRREEDTASKLADEKPFEEALSQIIKRSPSLSKLFLLGTRLSNPFSQVEVAAPVRFEGKLHPTLFKFKDRPYGEVLARECHLDQRLRLTFETDAANDYFKRTTNPGKLSVTAELSGKPTTVDHALNLHDGYAHLNIRLPRHAEVNDRMQLVINVRDATLVEAFENRATIAILRQQAQGPGGAGPRKSHPDVGSDGRKELRPTGISFPRVTEVHRDEWGSRKMDDYSALRIEDAGENEDPTAVPVYDFFINMDNIFLQSEIKSTKRNSDVLRAQFKFGITLAGLGMIKQHADSSSSSEGANQQSTDGMAVEDFVAMGSDGLAPMLLPMIESLGDLDAEDLEVSASSETAIESES